MADECRETDAAGDRNRLRRADVYGDGMAAMTGQPNDAEFAALLAGARAGSG